MRLASCHTELVLEAKAFDGAREELGRVPRRARPLGTQLLGDGASIQSLAVQVAATGCELRAVTEVSPGTHRHWEGNRGGVSAGPHHTRVDRVTLAPVASHLSAQAPQERVFLRG